MRCETSLFLENSHERFWHTKYSATPKRSPFFKSHLTTFLKNKSCKTKYVRNAMLQLLLVFRSTKDKITMTMDGIWIPNLFFVFLPTVHSSRLVLREKLCNIHIQFTMTVGHNYQACDTYIVPKRHEELVRKLDLFFGFSRLNLKYQQTLHPIQGCKYFRIYIDRYIFSTSKLLQVRLCSPLLLYQFLLSLPPLHC